MSADKDLLTLLGLSFGLALLMQICIGVLRGWSIIHLSSQLGLKWMSNIFTHLLKLPLDFFEKRHLGDITSRLSSVQSIQRTLTNSFVEAIIDGLMAAVTLALMLAYHWKLALITLLATLLYAAIRAAAFRPLRDSTEQQLVASGKQQGHLLETLRGVQSLKVSSGEANRTSMYENLIGNTINREIHLARISLGFTSGSQIIFGMERIAVIWIGASLALQNVFSVGMLIAYLTYKDQFSQRMGVLIDRFIEFRMLKLHGERLADIVLSPPDTANNFINSPPPKDMRIEVDDISFRYAEGEPWILQNCTFTINPGESVAIIGASGCGKSTLLKIMLGLIKPTHGSVRIGGSCILKMNPFEIRTITAAVMQDDQLFAGSIAENIGSFQQEVEMERVEESSKQAGVYEEVVSMPMGFNSHIGDMGSALSGGQKQRIILARALYRSPKILFLDEATSHLGKV